MMLGRDDMLQKLAAASHFGYLGLFVGTGFSRALTGNQAPTFEQLIRDISAALALGYNLDDPAQIRGRSYPQIASELCALTAERMRQSNPGATDIEALEALKRAVANRCDLSPEEPLRSRYRSTLARLRLSWVITTNYDFVLESLIDGAVSLLPTQALTPRPDFIPIYHLHGHRLKPESIIITEEDYIQLLGPLEYRQLKLSLLLAESATLVLGYGIGDINVRSALQWSKAFSGDPRFVLEEYQRLVVQALYTQSSPRPEPYLGPNGEVILEINDIHALLEELATRCDAIQQTNEKARQLVAAFFGAPTAASTFAKTFADDPKLRKLLVDVVKKFPRFCQTTQIEKFLADALDPVWQLARSEGGFTYYDSFLETLIDIFAALPLEKMHPALFANLAERLASIADFVEPSGALIKGYSFRATNTWRRRKSEIPDATRTELLEFARRRWKASLERLLR